MAGRNTEQRRIDTIRRLERDANVWVSTADGTGGPHLIPLSLAWDGVRVLLATPTDSPTVRNATASGRIRAALDNADDVVLIDASVTVVDFNSADDDMARAYVERVGWNPGDQPGEWSLLVLEPRTVRAWRTEAEIEGRTIMRRGEWEA